MINGGFSEAEGCIVVEAKENSFDEGFAKAGGGLRAMPFNVGAVNIWLWSVSSSFLYISSMLCFFEFGSALSPNQYKFSYLVSLSSYV
jgi:hypothetical protein